MGLYVPGEVLDFDSTTTARAGIGDATLTQRSGTGTDTTSPDGQFEMCASSTANYLFDVDVPATHTDAILYVEIEATGGWHPITLRSWTPARATTFFASRGLTYDPAKAHVFVVHTADGADYTLTGGSHGPHQRGDDSGPGAVTWGQGGRFDLFPNVDPTAGTITLTGDFSGPHVVPVELGKITFAAISVVVL